MGERHETIGNPDLLRWMIDAGKTYDKVRFLDPAAAPLGTDDEAGSTPPSAAEVSEAIRIETRPVIDVAAVGAPDVWRRIALLLVFAVPAVAVALLVLLAVQLS